MIGDEVLSINGKPCHQFKLYELIAMFSSEEGKRISMEIRSGGQLKQIKFQLKSAF